MSQVTKDAATSTYEGRFQASGDKYRVRYDDSGSIEVTRFNRTRRKVDGESTIRMSVGGAALMANLTREAYRAHFSPEGRPVESVEWLYNEWFIAGEDMYRVRCDRAGMIDISRFNAEEFEGEGDGEVSFRMSVGGAGLLAHHLREAYAVATR